jgi:hypothetical protein
MDNRRWLMEPQSGLRWRRLCRALAWAICNFPLAILCLPSPAAAQTPQRIDVAVERRDAAGWRAVNPATVFSAGDRLRFRVSSTFAGYLYVVDHGTSGSYDLLFPRSGAASGNRIAAATDVIVPEAQGSFRVGGPPGHDVIYWLVSPVEFGRQYKPLPSAPGSGPPPPSFRPRCGDEVFKARGECLDATAGIHPVKPGDKLPENMNGFANAASRDLVFTEEPGQTAVSSPTPLSGPILYELRLAHR